MTGRDAGKPRLGPRAEPSDDTPRLLAKRSPYDCGYGAESILARVNKSRVRLRCRDSAHNPAYSLVTNFNALLVGGLVSRVLCGTLNIWKIAENGSQLEQITSGRSLGTATGPDIGRPANSVRQAHVSDHRGNGRVRTLAHSRACSGWAAECEAKGKDLGPPAASTGLQQDCSPPGFGSIHTHNFSAAGRVCLDCA